MRLRNRKEGSLAAAHNMEILPWSVRFALHNKDYMFGQEEIESLVHSAAFAASGFYCALKYADGRPEVQLESIQEVVSSIAGGDADYSSALGLLDQDSRPVEGGKLLRIGRYGQEIWENGFDDALAQLDERHTLYALGYAAFSGIRPIIERSQEQGFGVRFLLAKRFVAGEDLVGFTVDYAGVDVTVSVLERSFKRTAHDVVLDDVISSGRTRDAIFNAWRHKGSDQLPEFISAVENHR